MKLTIEDIKKITQGAVDVKDNQGRVKFYRFTEAESATYECKPLYTTAGVQLEFTTDAKELKLALLATHALESRGFFCVDVFIDGKYYDCLKNINDDEIKGDYASKEYNLGSYNKTFILGNGDKIVRIVLPHSVIVEIEELDLVGATFFEEVKPDKTIIAYGDSITQGYDAVHPSATYAVQLARYLGAQLCNKGISGAPFIAELPKVSEYENPDYVTIAYGVNDWGNAKKPEFIEYCSKFIKNIEEKYPKSKKFVITPIWCEHFEEERPFGPFLEVEKTIKEICKNHPDIKVISGFDLVPHKVEMYGDLRLHPSDEGFLYYFENLKKEMSL